MKALFLSLLLSSIPSFAGPVPFDHLRSYLTKWEGYRTEVYPDAGGYSVGIGHFLGKSAPAKREYSHAEIQAFFHSDIQAAIRICRQGIRDFDSLEWNIQSVCISLAFNVGPTGFMKFQKFRAAVSARNYGEAAKELQNSKWASQVGAARREDHVRKMRVGKDSS